MFDWDEANVGHIARHEGRPYEGWPVSGCVVDMARRASAGCDGLDAPRALKMHYMLEQGRTRVKMIVTGVPKSATEKEEAEWWDANPDLMTQLFLRADTKQSGTNGSKSQPTLRVALTAEDVAQSNRAERAIAIDKAA